MRLGLAVFILFSQGCCSYQGGDSARETALRSVLIEENRDIMYREADLVRGKFAKMSSGLYPYFRGTYGVFLFDQSVGTLAFKSDFGSADSSLVQIVGDPHPENIGSYRDGSGTIVVEINDFDAATFGPYYQDVRRLALGFYTLARVANIPQAEAAELGAIIAGSYRERIFSGEGQGLPDQAGGKMIVDLIEDAVEDGGERKQLSKNTKINPNGEREMLFSAAEFAEEGFIDKELAGLTPDEHEMVSKLVVRYATTTVRETGDIKEYTPKGISRRIGAGVSSYALRRFYVLLEGQSMAVDDDILLEVREVRDPPQHDPRRVLFPSRPALSNGERAVLMQRRAHKSPVSDIHAGWATLGGNSFKVRERTGYQDGLDAAKIAKKLKDGAFNMSDLRTVASYSAALLADSHTRAPTATNKESRRKIQVALGDDDVGFAEETKSFVRTYGAQLEKDYEYFSSLLRNSGPLLGARQK